MDLPGKGVRDLRRLTARVHGRVQGVGYRMFAVREARRLGVRGFVRNCPDGTVEAVGEGAEEQLTRWRAMLQRGPQGAQVREADSAWSEATGEFRAFDVRY